VRCDVLLTSQQEFAIWQPAWPTIRVENQYVFVVYMYSPHCGRCRRVPGVLLRTVQANDFSHPGGKVSLEVELGSAVGQEVLVLAPGRFGWCVSGGGKDVVRDFVVSSLFPLAGLWMFVLCASKGIAGTDPLTNHNARPPRFIT